MEPIEVVKERILMRSGNNNMVLQPYQSLKEMGSQDSLSIHSGTMMRRTSNAGSMTSAGPSCLNLSALTLSEKATSHHSSSHLSSFAQNSHQVTLRRGWGSAETRRASTSLSTMAGQAQEYSRQVPARPLVDTNSAAATEKDGWGYFVDVPEEDNDDALMW